MIPLFSKHPALLGASALTLGAAIALSVSPAAHAGDYTVNYCPPGAQLRDFKLLLRSAGGSGGCIPSGGLQVTMDNTGSIPGVQAALIADIPSGVTPVYLRASGTLLMNTPASPGMYGGFADEQCSTGSGKGCDSGQLRALVVDRPLGSSPDIGFQIRCNYPDVGCANSSGQVVATQYAVTFRDTQAPTGSASATALTPAADGTPVHGTQTVSYSTSDVAGSGIKRVEARFDGQTVAATADQCSEPYPAMQPCPGSAAGDLAIDTSRVADGPHAVTIVGIDASGNEANLATTATVTLNGSNVGPGSDVAIRGAVNGSYAGDDAKITAGWPATARAASKSKTVQRRCKSSKSYRRKHAIACVGRPAQPKLRVSFSRKKSNLVRGRLITPGGDPVSNATVNVVATPAASGATSSVVATAVTDEKGAFKATVPVAAGSATYSVQWAARARDTRPAAAAKLSRAVRASSSLSVTPGRVVYRRQNLTFSGKLAGATGTPKGTAVLMQVNAGNGWRALTTVRARPSGRWTARYRVLPQLGGHYRFRALIRPSAAYAYASGTSRSITVSVR
jgi:hypothetical protein